MVVRRGEEVAVFTVGTDTQNIRTHGLYLPIEADTVRGTPSLVRKLNVTDRVHLCRNLVCTEDATEHFTEYGAVKKFNAERFQLSQSHQGALSMSRHFWDWFAPRGQRTVSEVVGRIREFASESETEDVTCCASQITWMTDEGLTCLAETRCSVGGQIFHQAIDGDFPGSCTKCLCPKHATLYLSKRYQDKCGVVDCLKQGTASTLVCGGAKNRPLAARTLPPQQRGGIDPGRGQEARLRSKLRRKRRRMNPRMKTPTMERCGLDLC